MHTLGTYHQAGTRVFQQSAALPPTQVVFPHHQDGVDLLASSTPPGAVSVPEESKQRPKKGDADYVPRPPNAFMLFRSHYCKGKKQRQVDLNKTMSQQWNALPPEERAKWKALAGEKKKEHKTRYPNYKFCPQRSNAKNRRTKPQPGGCPSAPTAPLQASLIHDRTSLQPSDVQHTVFSPLQLPASQPLEGSDRFLSPSSSLSYHYMSSSQIANEARLPVPAPHATLPPLQSSMRPLAGDGGYLSPALSTPYSGPSYQHTGPSAHRYPVPSRHMPVPTSAARSPTSAAACNCGRGYDPRRSVFARDVQAGADPASAPAGTYVADAHPWGGDAPWLDGHAEGWADGSQYSWEPNTAWR